jgi:hypothetical protein
MLKFTRRTAATALIVTVVLPGSALAAQDLRNPDRRAPVVHQQPNAQDLRNPDNRTSYQPQLPGQDLRNADQRAPVTGTEVVTPIQPAPATVPAATDGFDWTDAGIGAAGGLALVSIAGGLAMGMTHRRRGARVPA